MKKWWQTEESILFCQYLIQISTEYLAWFYSHKYFAWPVEVTQNEQRLQNVLFPVEEHLLRKYQHLHCQTLPQKESHKKPPTQLLYDGYCPAFMSGSPFQQELSWAEIEDWSFTCPRKQTCMTPVLVLYPKDNPCVRKMIYRGGPRWRSRPKLLLLKLLQEWQPAVREAEQRWPSQHLCTELHRV